MALGVVCKAANPIDQRRVNLTLSAKGTRLLLDLAPFQRQINDILFGPLSATDFSRLCLLMAELRKSVGKAAAASDRILQGGKDRP